MKYLNLILGLLLAACSTTTLPAQEAVLKSPAFQSVPPAESSRPTAFAGFGGWPNSATVPVDLAYTGWDKMMEFLSEPGGLQIHAVFESADRATTEPAYIGQLATETDTGIIYRATGLAAGNWSIVAELWTEALATETYVDNAVDAANKQAVFTSANRASTSPEYIGQLGSQLNSATGEGSGISLWYGYGTNPGEWIQLTGDYVAYDYNSLTDALDDAALVAGTPKVTIDVASKITITADTTIPEYVTLNFISAGCGFDLQGLPGRIEINGPIIGGVNQIFWNCVPMVTNLATGNVVSLASVYGKLGRVDKWSYWWGPPTQGGEASSDWLALQCMVDAVAFVGGNAFVTDWRGSANTCIFRESLFLDYPLNLERRRCTLRSHSGQGNNLNMRFNQANLVSHPGFSTVTANIVSSNAGTDQLDIGDSTVFNSSDFLFVHYNAGATSGSLTDDTIYKVLKVSGDNIRCRLFDFEHNTIDLNGLETGSITTCSPPAGIIAGLNYTGVDPNRYGVVLKDFQLFDAAGIYNNYDAIYCSASLAEASKMQNIWMRRGASGIRIWHYCNGLEISDIAMTSTVHAVPTIPTRGLFSKGKSHADNTGKITVTRANIVTTCDTAFYLEHMRQNALFEACHIERAEVGFEIRDNYNAPSQVTSPFRGSVIINNCTSRCKHAWVRNKSKYAYVHARGFAPIERWNSTFAASAFTDDGGDLQITTATNDFETDQIVKYNKTTTANGSLLDGAYYRVFVVNDTTIKLRQLRDNRSSVFVPFRATGGDGTFTHTTVWFDDYYANTTKDIDGRFKTPSVVNSALDSFHGIERWYDGTDSTLEDSYNASGVRYRSTTHFNSEQVYHTAMAMFKSNLAHWWSMNETSGTRADSLTALDLGLTGTLASVIGKRGNATDFPATGTDYLSTSGVTYPDITGNWSIALWVNVDSLAANRTICGIWDSASNKRCAYLYAANTGQKFRLGYSSNGTASAELISTPGVTSGSWFHVAFGYDGTDVWLQINDNARESITTSLYNTDDVHFFVGVANSAGLSPLDGKVDEVSFYATTLLSEDCIQLYNEGFGRTYNEVIE